MKNNQEKTNKNKWKYIIASSLVIGAGAGIAGSLYLKNKNIDTEHISKSENDNDSTNNISSNNIPTKNIVDIKDFAYSNKLAEENLNQFVSYEKLLNNNFLYLKRDSSFSKLELYKTNKNGDLVQKLNIEGDNKGQIELNSIIELSDESLVLQVEEYISNMEASIYSLRRYNKNGELEFNKIIDNNIDILNLYSSNNLDGFISMESDSNGDMNIVKYNFNGEEAFRYKIGYYYTYNIDVVFKENKIAFISKDNSSHNIIELDENGKEIRKINMPYNDIRVDKLFTTSDNGYIVSFAKNNGDDYESIESYYIKIDSNGKEEWTYSEKSNSFTRSINEINDGYILLNKDVYYEQNEDNINVSNLYSILKIDKSGNKEWVKYININDESNSSIFTINGEYMEGEFLVVSGILEDSENNAYHIKFSIDKDGYISSVNNDDIDAVG